MQAPISCGEVLSVDATRAVGLPDFAAMVSHADTEVLQASPAAALIRERTIHFCGPAGRARAAGSLQEAKEAAHAIQVSLEARPAVTALAQALDKSFAPAMVGRFPGETRRGDARERWLRPICRPTSLRHAVNNHHPMRTARRCLLVGSGKAVVHTSTQCHLRYPEP